MTQSPSYEMDVLRENAINGKALLERYLCPEQFIDIQPIGQLSDDAGYFRFGQNICYGRSASGYRTKRSDGALYDATVDVRVSGLAVGLPFDPTNVIDNLRLERYTNQDSAGILTRCERLLKRIYYFLRPLMHVKLRSRIQRAHLNGWRKLSFPQWPVDTTVEDLCEHLLMLSMKARGVDKVPFIWFWPDGAESCVAMTHDVETEKGRDFCTELMNIDDSFGIKSSFQVVPEGRYDVSDAFIQAIRHRGFEINIQDLNHDGNLFRNRNEFDRRAHKINKYAETYEASGFRAAVLYRNLDWYEALRCSFDMSVPSVAHLDPQKGGCCTVMPYFFGDTLEIPVTTIQDYMLFHLLNEYSMGLWRQQTDLIVKRNGLVTFIVHPDYIMEHRARGIYRELLAFLRELIQTRRIWVALPGEINRWWRTRHELRVVGEEGDWRILGEGAERARLAFAYLEDKGLRYEIEA